MPGGHIFNKDGTRMIKVRTTPQTPTLETSISHDTNSNGLIPSEAVSGTTAVAPSGSSKKKKKKKGKGGTLTQPDTPIDPLNHDPHLHLDHHHHHHSYESSRQGPSKKSSHSSASGHDISLQHVQEYQDAIRASLAQFNSNEYREGEADDVYYSDEEPAFAGNQYDGPADTLPPGEEGPSTKKKNKKKKKKGAGNQPNDTGHDPSNSVAHSAALKANKDRIWNTSTSEERERIKIFWLSLGEDERRSLVKVEKEAVLKKMKEQQKHSCSCSVCGRKRTAIEEELEVLYDAYYEELEHPSKGLPNPQHPNSRRVDDLPELEEDEEPYDDEEDGDEYEGISDESKEASVQQDFFNFGNSLTVRGGILTVADDLLKNDGKKFIEMMEQLAERRMAREEEATHAAHQLNPQMHNLSHHNHVSNGNQEYDIEDDEEEYDEDDDDFEEDEEDEPDAMTEEQRMEEGRRMFQIFAARMFEQRVLAAYRERVAQERQTKLLEELAEEDRLKEEQKNRKAKEKEKKKDKKKLQKQQKEEERLRKEAEKAEEEAAQKAVEEQKAEEARRKKEEQRLKREAEKKAADEERQRKEEEKKRRQQEERERELEREKKRKEQVEREKKKKEDQARKQKEEKEQREKERKEKEDKDRRDREAKRKAAEEREKARKEAEAAVAVPKIATTPVLSKAANVPSHNLVLPQVVPAVVSPRLAVAAPALPKSPGRGKPSSIIGSVTNSPQTPKVQTRATAATTQTQASITAAAQLPASTTAAAVSNTPVVANASVKRPDAQTQPIAQPATSTPLPTPVNPPPGVPPIQNAQAFPTHISPPPGVPPPEAFSLQHQSPFLPPVLPPGVNRQHVESIRSMFPPPGQMPPFGMQGAFRGFPVGQGVPRGFSGGQTVPMGPPPSNMRGFPPHGQNLFMGDFAPLPQPMPGSNFPPPPGSPFMRQENIGPSHTRSSSSEHNEINPSSTPKPIHRPTPIQRPSNAVANSGSSKVNVDELSTSLGSSALLGDDEPEEPSLPKPEGISPSRRSSNLASGRGVFGIPPGPSPFFMGHDARNPPYGMLPSPSNTWGAPSPVPLFSSLPGGTWSTGAPLGAGWATDPDSGRINHNQRRQTRLDVIRLLAVQMYQDAPQAAKLPGGFMRLSALQESILNSGQLNALGEISADELMTVTEIEGDIQNGGGFFQHKRDESGNVVLRYDLHENERRASSGAGLVGTPIAGPGEIGSPVTNHALPFSSRQGSGASPNVPHF